MKNTLEKIIRDGFILVFNSEVLDVVQTAEALENAGINNMEVTCRISNSLEKIKKLKSEKPDFMAGAASLIDYPDMLSAYNSQNPQKPVPTIDEVVEVGSDYLVSAVNFSEETYLKYKGKIPIVPGCGTLSEITSQYNKGASFCKLFPASVIGGVKFITSVDPAVHKMISIMPTGGTNSSNIPEYVKAGVLIFGGSFSMIDKAVMQKIFDNQDYNLLAEEFKKVKKLIDDCRAEQYPNLDFETASLEEITKATGRNFNIN